MSRLPTLWVLVCDRLSHTLLPGERPNDHYERPTQECTTLLTPQREFGEEISVIRGGFRDGGLWYWDPNPKVTYTSSPRLHL